MSSESMHDLQGNGSLPGCSHPLFNTYPVIEELLEEWKLHSPPEPCEKQNMEVIVWDFINRSLARYTFLSSLPAVH